MLELVAERGCGYVLMHIEGPPRVDRPAPALRRRRSSTCSDWFAERLERGRASSGSTPERIALDPGLDFDLARRRRPRDPAPARRAARARPAAVRRPLAQGLPRRGRSPARGRSALAADGARAGDAGGDGARGRRRAPRSCACTTSRRSTRCGPRPRSRGVAPWRRMRCLARRPAARLGAPARGGRDDERLVATSVEAARGAAHGRAARRSAPALAAALARAGIERALLAPGRGARGRAGGRRDRHQRHRLGQVARRSTCRCSTRSPPTRRRRALYIYPTKALAQDQARKLSELGSPELRHAIYDGDTPREDRPAIRRRSNLVLTNPDMLNMALLAHHKGWGDFLANLGWVVVDEAHTYRGVFGSHVANVLRRLRRVAARLRRPSRGSSCASATIANPVELAERLIGDASSTLVDSDGAPRARRRIAIWNPPVIDEKTDAPALGALGGGRAARGPGRQRLADDLLPAQPPRDRADPALHPDAPRGARRARARGADRALPRRLHAAAAARDRGRASRAASCSRSSPPTRSSSASTSASSTRRSASPSPARSPACGRCGAARAGAARGSPLYVAGEDALDQFFCRHPDEFLDAPGRGGDPRPHATSGSRPRTCSPPPTRRRSAAPRAAGRRTTRSSASAGASAPTRWSAPASCAAARDGRYLPRGAGLPGGRDLAALGLARLGRGGRARLGRAARPGRGRARVLDRPPGRDLPAPRALLRGRRARRRLAPGDRRRRSTATGTRSRRRRPRSSSRRVRARRRDGAPASSSASARSRSPSR